MSINPTEPGPAASGDEPSRHGPLGGGPCRDARPAQPALGLRGLVLVVPIAVALAIGAGGDGSVLVIGPLVTLSLPLVVMVAFWWNGRPGIRLRPAWSGWADTALIAAGAVVLAGIGQAAVGGFDLAGLFDPHPGPGHVPTFPATLTLGGAAFVAMLQLTLVGEGRPLHRLPRLPAGLLAVAVSWAIALAVSRTLVRIDAPAGSDVTAHGGPVSGAGAGAVLISISAWQVLFYVVWGGWPYSLINRSAARLTVAHVTVLGGVLTFAAGHALGLDATRIAALAGCFAAAGLLFGMLFEGWIRGRAARPVLLVLTAAAAALLAAGLDAIAATVHFTDADTDDWVEHASLNALSTSIILHVAIGRRWPFASRRALSENSTGKE
ncbi:hypothetical protein [Actinomadura sp. GTD37]|uniref:hypothetical protein n=1 Tax=Actinomadura sp. GTD37 TaxID=1778030 RepID=UPI0035C00599